MEHVNATGEQLNLALKKEEAKTESIVKQIDQISKRIKKLES